MAIPNKRATDPKASSIAAEKQRGESLIDAFLRSMGLDPAAVTRPNGMRDLRLGSARGFAGAFEGEGHSFFHAAAMVMPLPSDGDLIVPLMRELLKINGFISGAARLCITGTDVCVAVTEPIKSMGDDDFGRHIRSVMALADQFDDELRKKYGGTSKRRP